MEQLEPKITINNNQLTPGQAMTVRTAIEDFSISLRSTGLGDDDAGKSLTKAYLKNIDLINVFLYDVSP